MNLTEAQIKQIPELINDGQKTVPEVASLFNVHPNAIHRWIKKLRTSGYVINLKRGRRSKIHL